MTLREGGGGRERDGGRGGEGQKERGGGDREKIGLESVHLDPAGGIEKNERDGKDRERRERERDLAWGASALILREGAGGRNEVRQ